MCDLAATVTQPRLSGRGCDGSCWGDGELGYGVDVGTGVERRASASASGVGVGVGVGVGGRASVSASGVGSGVGVGVGVGSVSGSRLGVDVGVGSGVRAVGVAVAWRDLGVGAGLVGRPLSRDDGSRPQACRRRPTVASPCRRRSPLGPRCCTTGQPASTTDRAGPGRPSVPCGKTTAATGPAAANRPTRCPTTRTQTLGVAPRPDRPAAIGSRERRVPARPRRRVGDPTRRDVRQRQPTATSGAARIEPRRPSAAGRRRAGSATGTACAAAWLGPMRRPRRRRRPSARRSDASMPITARRSSDAADVSAIRRLVTSALRPVGRRRSAIRRGAAVRRTPSTSCRRAHDDCDGDDRR